jgi:glyoxylase-like metal-dependent hydrolase (beta-lactamase superfamily II)
MTILGFDRAFEAKVGECISLSPLVRRVLCNNPGPFTFKGTSTFIVGRGRVAVVDPGPEDEEHLTALINAVRNETVTHILITHTHADHSPLAARLRQVTGATTCGFGAHESGRMQSGVITDAGADRSFIPDLRVSNGDRIFEPGWTIEAVHTPGHTSNHMAYALKEEGSLFCGDHVMAWATSVIAPPDGNMGQYLDSLRMLLDRDEEIYYPTHGPSARDPKSLVRAYIAHRKMREQAILNRLGRGDRKIDAIVSANYADLDPRLHAAAALSTLAHLEQLIDEGRVETDGPPTIASEYRLSREGQGPGNL